MKYRKKPIVIEAVQWEGDNQAEIFSFIEDKGFYDKEGELWIKTLEGTLQVPINFWIIKGTQGEYYPCHPQAFIDSYDKVEE